MERVEWVDGGVAGKCRSIYIGMYMSICADGSHVLYILYTMEFGLLCGSMLAFPTSCGVARACVDPVLPCTRQLST